jgi:hypothetical protein
MVAGGRATRPPRRVTLHESRQAQQRGARKQDGDKDDDAPHGNSLSRGRRAAVGYDNGNIRTRARTAWVLRRASRVERPRLESALQRVCL